MAKPLLLRPGPWPITHQSPALLIHPDLEVEQAVPAIGIVGRAVTAQMIEPLQRLFKRWDMPFRDRPHHEGRLRLPFEPAVLLAVDALVRGIPDEMLERLGALPHGHVGDLLR